MTFQGLLSKTWLAILWHIWRDISEVINNYIECPQGKKGTSLALVSGFYAFLFVLSNRVKKKNTSKRRLESDLIGRNFLWSLAYLVPDFILWLSVSLSFIHFLFLTLSTGLSLSTLSGKCMSIHSFRQVVPSPVLISSKRNYIPKYWLADILLVFNLGLLRMLLVLTVSIGVTWYTECVSEIVTGLTVAL